MSKINSVTEYLGITPAKAGISPETPVDKLNREIKYDKIQSTVSLGAIACYGVFLEQFMENTPEYSGDIKLLAIGGTALLVGDRIRDIAKRTKRTKKNLQEIKQIQAQDSVESSLEEA
ncbi:MAG: hypothetical protein Q7T74_03415 [Candidatus Saccharibacteria bacterium]|nr:hypothetical protein [Candidatus Saccharibacteria bacterium]